MSSATATATATAISTSQGSSLDPTLDLAIETRAMTLDPGTGLTADPGSSPQGCPGGTHTQQSTGTGTGTAPGASTYTQAPTIRFRELRRRAEMVAKSLVDIADSRLVEADGPGPTTANGTTGTTGTTDTASARSIRTRTKIPGATEWEDEAYKVIGLGIRKLDEMVQLSKDWTEWFEHSFRVWTKHSNIPAADKRRIRKDIATALSTEGQGALLSHVKNRISEQGYICPELMNEIDEGFKPFVKDRDGWAVKLDRDLSGIGARYGQAGSGIGIGTNTKTDRYRRG
ncbi:hypothetical protein IAT40_006917 [Kwoniella sp. CBS 6097]